MSRHRHKLILIPAFLFAMFTFFKNLFAAPDQTALREALANKAFLVDVRTPGEFSGGSVTGAVNIPLGELPKQLARFKGKKHIVVFCRSGNRSSSAKAILTQNGFTQVVDGGTWQQVQKALEP